MMKFPFIIKSRRAEEADRQYSEAVYEELVACKEKYIRQREVLEGMQAGVDELRRQAYVKGVKDGTAHVKQQVMQHARSSVK